MSTTTRVLHYVFHVVCRVTYGDPFVAFRAYGNATTLIVIGEQLELRLAAITYEGMKPGCLVAVHLAVANNLSLEFR